MYLRDTTVISPYDLLLFGGDISVQHQVSSFPFTTCSKKLHRFSSGDVLRSIVCMKDTL